VDPLLIGQMPVVVVSPRLNWPLDLVTKIGEGSSSGSRGGGSSSGSSGGGGGGEIGVGRGGGGSGGGVDDGSGVGGVGGGVGGEETATPDNWDQMTPRQQHKWKAHQRKRKSKARAASMGQSDSV
jgi:hypothetical protein